MLYTWDHGGRGGAPAMDQVHKDVALEAERAGQEMRIPSGSRRPRATRFSRWYASIPASRSLRR